MRLNRMRGICSRAQVPVQRGHTFPLRYTVFTGHLSLQFSRVASSKHSVSSPLVISSDLTLVLTSNTERLVLRWSRLFGSVWWAWHSRPLQSPCICPSHLLYHCDPKPNPPAKWDHVLLPEHAPHLLLLVFSHSGLPTERPSLPHLPSNLICQLRPFDIWDDSQI